MELKAILICDDVRFELGGTMTAVGIGGERIVVEPGDGPITIPRLAFVAIVRGLRGIEEVAYRNYVVPDGPDAGEPPELRREPHAPDSDEHTFVLGAAPMVFADAGPHVFVVEVTAGAEHARYPYRFTVQRAG